MTRTKHAPGTINPDRRTELSFREHVTLARSQLAIARTLLAELDRILPVGTAAVDEQLAGELRRLSCLLVEIAQPFGGEAVSSRPLLRALPRPGVALGVRRAGRRS